MKKVIIVLMFLVSIMSYAQDKTNKKFQVGISYSLTNNDAFYNHPISFYANYRLKKWDKVDVSAGLKSYYFRSNISPNFSNKLGFNPNFSASYHIIKDKLNTYFGFGYYFDQATFKPTPTGYFSSPNQSIKTSGVTIVPGLKYFVHPNIFIDSNLTFLITKTKYESSDSKSNTNIYFNVGIGVAF